MFYTKSAFRRIYLRFLSIKQSFAWHHFFQCLLQTIPVERPTISLVLKLSPSHTSGIVDLKFLL